MDAIELYNRTKSKILEEYRTIRVNIQFSNFNKDVKSIVFTSSEKNEGNTTIVSNMAICFSTLENKKVLIIDGNLRKPSIHEKFCLENKCGLTDILINQCDISKSIQTTSIENLHVITAGKIVPNPSEIINSKIMKNYIETLKDSYSYIFIDSPSINTTMDAAVLSTYTDGTILVVGSNMVDVDLVKNSKEKLERLNINILGVILNKVKYKNKK